MISINPNTIENMDIRTYVVEHIATIASPYLNL